MVMNTIPIFRLLMLLTLGSIFSRWAYSGEVTTTNVVTLARHETVAEFCGTSYHQCMGLTSLCPDKCGQSGTMASFKITKYLSYEKLGEYGDPKCEQYVFMLEDNMKRPKVSPAIQATVASLKKGDLVFLSWHHDYVTVGGSSGPERPLIKLQKIPD
jgi:hypothetical protein